MDENVARWILEFLLRKPVDDKIINGVLSRLPLSNKDSRLKKMILLRKMESEISNRCVSEKLLELLEILEELDHRKRKRASDLMKEAYCAIAVDCTVRFLEENVEDNGKYFEAVERVWRSRVCKMEGLSSEELNRWLNDIEAAVMDSSICEKIMMRNTRNEALKAVKGYLKEVWKSMGPSYLELAAEKVGDEVEALLRGGDGAVVGSGNLCRALVVSQAGMHEQSKIRRKHVAVKMRRPRGAKISDGDEDDTEEPMNTANDVSPHKMDKVQETLQSNTMELHAAVTDPHLDASQAAHGSSFAKAKGSMSIANAAVNQTKAEIHATPEVSRVQEALKSSSRELHVAVTDPLPEAFQIAKALASTRVTGNHEAAMENQTGAKIHMIPEVDKVRETLETSSVHAAVKNLSPDASQTVKNVSSTMAAKNTRNDAVLGPGIHAPREHTEDNTDSVDKNGKVTEDALGNETHDPMEQHKRKRSFMEPNGTTQTFEWDDSIDDYSGGLHVGARLPRSPKRSKVSPLHQYEEKKIAYRRDRKKWTPAEEDVLRVAVQKFGRRWKLILGCYGDAFKDRTDVDLKDKWRNLTKS